MPGTVTVAIAVLAGGLIDVGIYRLMVYSRRRAIQSVGLRRVTLRLVLLLALWIVVPFGEYYACSRSSSSAGYLFGWLFVFVGFVLGGVFGNRNAYLSDLRKLDDEDRPGS